MLDCVGSTCVDNQGSCSRTILSNQVLCYRERMIENVYALVLVLITVRVGINVLLLTLAHCLCM